MRTERTAADLWESNTTKTPSHVGAVSQYEVPQNLIEACKMARVAFEDAIAELDNVGWRLMKGSHYVQKAQSERSESRADDCSPSGA